MHLHQEGAVRTAEVHVELAVGSAHLALTAVALLERLRVIGSEERHVEEGHLVLLNLAIVVGEEDGVLTRSVVVREHLPQVDVLHNTHAVDYVLTLHINSYTASGNPDSWAAQAASQAVQGRASWADQEQTSWAVQGRARRAGPARAFPAEGTWEQPEESPWGQHSRERDSADSRERRSPEREWP